VGSRRARGVHGWGSGHYRSSGTNNLVLKTNQSQGRSRICRHSERVHKKSLHANFDVSIRGIDLPRFSHPCRTEDLNVSANLLGVR
jgi:hypothetical protein